MKQPDEIVAFVAQRIGHIYRRPLMYAGTSDGVDLILHYYHELWAEVAERQRDFDDALSAVANQEDCGSFGFASRYRVIQPEAEEDEIAQYVVTQWQKVSDLLAVPIPYLQIVQELESCLGPASTDASRDPPTPPVR